MPVIISKELFYEKITKDVCCNDIHYWSESCIKSIWSPNFWIEIIRGAGTFFLPIYLLKMFLDYKNKRKNLVKKFIEYEIRAMLYGFALGGTIITSACLLNKLWGRLHYYSLIFFPAFISGPSLLIEPKDQQNLNTLLFFNSFIETVLNKLKLTPIKELVLFMSLSGILMQLFENRTKKLDFAYFWIYTPPLQETRPESHTNKCEHEENCQSYLYNGIVNYFLVGFGINVTKRLLSSFKILPKYPAKILDVVFNKSNSDFGLFLGAYVGMYRFIFCYLVKSRKIDKKWHGLISGILAGLTYPISPTLQVSVVAITTILQILYDMISKKLKITNHFYQRLLVFSFCHAYNLHNKFYFPDTASPYYYKMIDNCTNNLTKKLYDSIIVKHFGSKS